ncbi:hypothetical protein K493DRAFT_317715 [Basidiobolus meristosporus CBS 931.73]|uniref:S-adenosyl-L-methionine-dependent methyltransferase n=1 Tax=Basidiobolus meristosporus CBS 931.73 TaxID=1314790 RepID=A0A1Y1XZJ0_9FUNG|nr:hypothetical protein K493DRAFT_321505 [Basidiobolus meristosporus CBS 931.73]ORX90784.1 hypothetical protein K493DRAFT_317715 [Basidiobolus meristosporus CBS 931.73]|eukprot:ORX76781.1 hypothetical protein K493DRAFT_321505 [Basidiobolus meristosporus CBS 931.73]
MGTNEEHLELLLRLKRCDPMDEAEVTSILDTIDKHFGEKNVDIKIWDRPEPPKVEDTTSDPSTNSTMVRNMCNDWVIRVLKRRSKDMFDEDPLMERLTSMIANRCGRAATGPVSQLWIFECQRKGMESVRLDIREPTFAEADLGCRTWSASIVMGKLLCGHTKGYEREVVVGEAGYVLDLSGQRILELGCGTGLAGLMCAKLGASHVMLTDYHPSVLDNVRINVNRNECEEICQVQKLDWWEYFKDSAKNIDNINRNIPISADRGEELYQDQFENIIATDAIYDAWQARAIPIVLEQFLSRATSSRIYFVLPLRNRYLTEIELFEEEMREAKFELIHMEIVDWRNQPDAVDQDNQDSGRNHPVLHKFYIYRRASSPA